MARRRGATFYPLKTIPGDLVTRIDGVGVTALSAHEIHRLLRGEVRSLVQVTIYAEAGMFLAQDRAHSSFTYLNTASAYYNASSS